MRHHVKVTVPDTPDEEAWLQQAEHMGYFHNGSDDAYTGNDERTGRTS